MNHVNLHLRRRVHASPPAVLGEAVCRCLLADHPGAAVLAPGTPHDDTWQVTLLPGGQGVQVATHRLVPYPDDPHQIVSVGYAQTLDRAVRDALTARHAVPYLTSR